VRSPRKPRHSCRVVPLLGVACAGLLGCTTTTRLTPVAGSTTEQAVANLAARPGSHARLTTAAPPLQPIANDAAGPYPVVGHGPGWLTLTDHLTSVQVPLVQVHSVSTYDHGRGAIDGALGAGAVGIVLGFAAGYALGSTRTCPADAPCQGSDPAISGLKGAAVFGLITAALGAAVGAVAGHETRYEIAPSAP
jgi:hypothetical protein